MPLAYNASFRITTSEPDCTEMPGLLLQRAGLAVSDGCPTNGSSSPSRPGWSRPRPSPSPSPDRDRVEEHVRHTAPLTSLPLRLDLLALHPHSPFLLPVLHDMAVNPGDPRYEAAHWRMPGEDDQGQAARAPLYAHDTDSETEYSFDGTDIEDNDLSTTPGASAQFQRTTTPLKHLEWDWDAEYADRAREKRHDGTDTSFQIDRRVLRDVVKEKLSAEVARIRFMSSGTHRRTSFHRIN